MIDSHRTLLAALLSLALFAGSAQAQQSDAKTQDADVKALREKAFSLLESVAGQLSSLQSAENRARLGANVADSLWEHDERRARELFQLVENDVRSELQKYDRRSGNHLTIMVFLKLRIDTVERIAKHDAAAALAFLKATKLNSEDPPKYASQSTEGVEMRLALKVARDNPEAALILGRETLDHGFSYELVTLLKQLNRKHKESAQDLFKEIVRKLQRTDLLTDWNARYFAGNLVRSFRPPAANESSFRELISVFVTSALKNGCANKPAQEDGRSQYCVWLAREVPEMEKFDARAAQLRHWNTNAAEDAVAQFPPDQEFFDLLEDGTNDEILALAARRPEVAEQVARFVIDRLRREGDIEKARKIANTLIADPERRQDILTRLDNFQKKIEINEALLAEIEERLKEIVQPLGRATYLLTYAHRVGVTDRNLALKLLGRASDVIDTMNPGKDQTRAQLVLAVMYCYEKSERGMAMMESIVPKLNELVDLAARLDGFETNYLRDGEWNMSANGAVGDLLTILSNYAGPFAWQDLDRAVSLASGFDRPEIRMMAQVKLAQGILAGPPKRMPIAYHE